MYNHIEDSTICYLHKTWRNGIKGSRFFVRFMWYGVFSSDDTAAILVSQSNERAVLVFQSTSVGVELFSYWNASFGLINLHRYWSREWEPYRLKSARHHFTLNQIELNVKSFLFWAIARCFYSAALRQIPTNDKISEQHGQRGRDFFGPLIQPQRRFRGVIFPPLARLA